MPVFALLILAAATFGLCFLADRLFTKLFRNHRQHRSGKSVRANSRYAAFGIILSVIGLAAAAVVLFYLYLFGVFDKISEKKHICKTKRNQQ